jgi:hypothetical protein
VGEKKKPKPPWSAAQAVDGITFLAFPAARVSGEKNPAGTILNIADNTPVKAVRYFLRPHRKPLEGLQILAGIFPAPNRSKALSDALASLAAVLKADHQMWIAHAANTPHGWLRFSKPLSIQHLGYGK